MSIVLGFAGGYFVGGIFYKVRHAVLFRALYRVLTDVNLLEQNALSYPITIGMNSYQWC